MNEIPISEQGPKGSGAQFLQDVERNAAPFGKFKPGYLLIQVQKKLGNLKRTQTTQKESGMNLQNKFRTCILHKSIES